MSSIANIASVRDVAAIGPRNREATAVPPTAKDGAQAPKTSEAAPEAKAGKSDPRQLGPKRLTSDQERLVQELAQIDQKVRAHESAHQAAAGSLGGAVSFTYETGPDGRSYAVGGEVPVDMSSGRTPEESLSKAEQIRAAALAPADPSPQDLSVAAQASQMEAAAREQLLQQQMAALHRTKPGHAAAVLGAQALHGRDVPLSRTKSSEPATASATAPAATHDPASAGDSSSVPDSSAPDVGEQVSATLATLESDRASAGASGVQVQRLAQLAVAAYSM